MGRYIRKSKLAGEISLMEISQSYLGVRTRAKTLALNRLQKLSAAEVTADVGGSYLQLRSRRLAKPTPIPAVDSKRQKHSLTNSSPIPISEEKSGFRMEEKKEIKENGDLSIEASFGENILEFESKERISRESTPISLIRDPESVRTPGSTTRPENSTKSNPAVQNPTRMYIPTTEELNMFFAEAEQRQQREFMEKYNFDPVKDEPLSGRFEWVKLDL